MRTRPFEFIGTYFPQVLWVGEYEFWLQIFHTELRKSQEADFYIGYYLLDVESWNNPFAPFAGTEEKPYNCSFLHHVYFTDETFKNAIIELANFLVDNKLVKDEPAYNGLTLKQALEKLQLKKINEL